MKRLFLLEDDLSLINGNVINLRKRTIPDTSILFDRIKVSGIVLETNLDIDVFYCIDYWFFSYRFILP